MFKIANSTSYFYPVTVEIVEDRGKRAKHTFDVQFARLPQSEIDEMFDPARENKLSDSQLIDRVVIGWRGVQDDDGSDVSFSQCALAEFLDIHGVRTAIVLAWMESMRGGAKQKN